MNRESTLDRPLPNSQLERQNDALAPPSINQWKRTGETWLVGLLLPATLALGWEISVAQG